MAEVAHTRLCRGHESQPSPTACLKRALQAGQPRTSKLKRHTNTFRAAHVCLHKKSAIFLNLEQLHGSHKNGNQFATLVTK